MRKFGLLLIPVLIAGACREPTQILVDITTDVPCAEVRSSSIRVSKPHEAAPPSANAVADGCPQGEGHVGSIVLVPSGDKSDPVTIEIVLGRNVDSEKCTAGDKSCIVARRNLRYLPHTPLRLPIKMSTACLGVACPDGQTCVEGQCAIDSVDPSRCVGAGCDEFALPLPDGGVIVPPGDGGVGGDGGGDGGTGDGGGAGDGGLDGAGGDGGTVFVSGLPPNLNQLANDATDVYYTLQTTSGGNTIGRCPKSTGTCVGLSGAPNAARIALGSGSVFWSDQNGVESCTLPGCTNFLPIRQPSLAQKYAGVSWYANAVFAVEMSASGGGSLLRCLGTACSPISSVASTNLYPADIAASANWIVYSIADRTTANPTGSVQVCQPPTCVGGPQPLILGLANAVYLAHDGTNVAVSENIAAGTVQGCAISGCVGGGTTPLGTGRVYPASVVIDNATAYWVEWGNLGKADGKLVRCPIAAGCGLPPVPQEILTGLDHPSGLTIDATSIYVAINGNSTILRIPKPP